MSLGPTEILLILAIALLFFGPSRLPGLGKSVGEAIRGFKKAINDPSEREALPPSEEDRMDQKTKQKDHHHQS